MLRGWTTTVFSSQENPIPNMALQPINANNGVPENSSAEKDIKASQHITGIEKAGRDVSLEGIANFTKMDSSVKEVAMSPSERENSPRDIHGWKWAMVVIATLSTTFLWALDNTIVADIQPAIIRSFNSVEKLPWLGVAFAVGAASTNLLWYVSPSHWAMCSNKMPGASSIKHSTINSFIS
jgi:hypothetical protein